MRPRITDIVALAAHIWMVPVSVVTSAKRSKLHTRPRFAACLVAHEHGYSYPMIGYRIGGRDHSTVMNAVKKARLYAEYDPDYADEIERLRRLAVEMERFVADRIAA